MSREKRAPASIMGLEQTSHASRVPKGILKVHRMTSDSRSQRSALSPVPSQTSSFQLGPKQVTATEPTYKTQPDQKNKFCAEKAERILKDVLESHLHKVKYDAEHCSRLAHTLCSVIKARIKDEGYDRYRLIAQVIIGQDTEQGVQLASRCLWNPLSDNFAAATYRNSSVYSIGLIYGLYLD
ncbi:hypothetical protein CAPTEDRAFT_151877 [Capitella teleta]|uniref:Tctex1 domain-containing protein 1 n=1 Tax=Capitella teleta TaxID=283909 RepID=R7V0T5_CAPTE|nr:hypothetical protein CAPTEDRAFT_151877 [Capitella teleta]|eukprot:ELU09301.1 hypothetical protein CAPTEDRAFT_151877 [Capitella teleta]